jgi:hypothetical protein
MRNLSMPEVRVITEFLLSIVGQKFNSYAKRCAKTAFHFESLNSYD